MEEKLLRFLPKLYARDDPGAALRHFVDAIVGQMETLETDLMRVGLSHYVDFASSEITKPLLLEEIDRIGSLLDIERIIERVEPDAGLNDAERLERHRKLIERYRKRLKDTALVYRRGLTTARAIASVVAAVFGLEMVEIVLPDSEKEVSFAGGALPVRTDAFTTAAVLRRPERDDEVFRLDIVDNPVRDRVRRALDQEPASDFSVVHRGLDGAHPRITIRAGKDPDKKVGAFGQTVFGRSHFEFSAPLALPILENRTLQQALFFNHVVPSEKELTIHFSEGRFSASLAGADVSEKLFFITGGEFTRSSFNRTRFAFAFRNAPPSEFPTGQFGAHRFGAAVFAALDPAAVLEDFLLPGENLWRFGQLAGPYQPGSRVEDLLEDIERQPAHLPREIRFDWQERARAAFAVRLPRGIGFLASARERTLFESTVRQVKAAGIEPIFDYQNIFLEGHDNVEATLSSIDRRRRAVAEIQEQAVSFSVAGILGRTYFGSSAFAANAS